MCSHLKGFFKQYFFILLIIIPWIAFGIQAKQTKEPYNEQNSNPQKPLQSLLKIQNLNGRFNESSCTGSGDNAVCAAVGFVESNGKHYPLVVVSKDGGKTFQVVKSLFSQPTIGTLLTVSCTGLNHGNSDHTTRCVAGGYLGNSIKEAKPLLIETQTSNVGKVWDQVSISGLYDFGLIKKVSCVGDGWWDASCIGVGWGNNDGSSSNVYPILVQRILTKDWANGSIANLPSLTKGKLDNASCTGDGKNAVCVAIGNHSLHHSNQPLLIQTNDGASIWTNKKDLFDLNHHLILTNVNCTGGNENAICTIIGRVNTNDSLFKPVIFQTKDRGTHWLKNSLDNFPTTWNGTINSVSCSVYSNNIQCAAVGSGSLKTKLKEQNTFPILFVLQNNTDQWLNASIHNGLADWNTLYSTTCMIGSCFAVGFSKNNGSPQPILAVSLDNQMTIWDAKKIKDLPSQGLLKSTACTQNGSACIAVGYIHDNGQDHLLLVESTDSGNTWATKTIESPQIPQNSYSACDDSSRCVAVIKNGTWQYDAYYSIDGRKTWINSFTGKSWGTYFWFDWNNKGTGFACGSTVTNCVAVGGSGNMVKVAVALRTVDGGVSWKATTYTGPCIKKEVSTFTSVQCDESGLNCIAKGFCASPLEGSIEFSASV